METIGSSPRELAPGQIRVRGLTKTYQRGGEPVQALAGIDLDIAPGTFAAVMGQSGSGKTTLLNMLTGVDRPSTGEVWLGSRRLDTMSEAQLAVLRRRRIGLIFQAFNLLANMSAVENVMLPALLVGESVGSARKRAFAVLQDLGLSQHAQKLPGQLSGGQQQRVAIARALVNDPDVLCADEPTGNLDARTGKEVMRVLRELHAQGKTIVLVTHDAQIASQAQRIVLMRDGRVIDEVESASRRDPDPRSLASALFADVSNLDLDA